MLNLRCSTPAAVVVLALAAAGCGGDDENEQPAGSAATDASTATVAEQTTATSETGDEQDPAEPKPDRKRENNDPVVEEDVGADAVGKLRVTGSEFVLERSEQALLTEGVWSVTFENAGTLTHALNVKGPNGESRSGRVEPGASKTFKAYLVDGSYELYCPIADHAERGMRTELPVRG